jgi:hypothetical protein
MSHAPRPVHVETPTGRYLGTRKEKPPSAQDAFVALNRSLGIAPLRTPAFEAQESTLPTPFRAGTAAAVSLGLAASAAHEIWRLRGGTQQDIAVDLKAAAASLRSFDFIKLGGETISGADTHKPTIGIYRGACGRWIHLHGGFPHLERRTLDLLNAANTREAVEHAVAKWNVLALEDSLAFMGQCGAVVRSEQEWKQSPQGSALSAVPPIVIKRIGDAPALRLPESDRPLDGVRVLDLTRVLAGPVVGRTLASHGADVLSVRSQRLPTIDLFDFDTGVGKRSTTLDLSQPSEAEHLRALARHGHVFVDSNRPGALARLGITPAALAHSSPGIVYVAVSCYGHQGPWAARRGWDELAQAATGLAAEQGAFLAEGTGQKREAAPQLIPAAVCDYIAGYLAAAGAAAALLRRHREGGSWLVQVSLASTAMWLSSLGRTEASLIPQSFEPDGLDEFLQSWETKRGTLTLLGPVIRMSKTQPQWHVPPPETGADPPRWLAA